MSRDLRYITISYDFRITLILTTSLICSILGILYLEQIGLFFAGLSLGLVVGVFPAVFRKEL